MDAAWERQYGSGSRKWALGWRWNGRVPWPHRTLDQNEYGLPALRGQIRSFSPDVLIIRGHTFLDVEQLRDIKKEVGLLVGQFATYLDPRFDLASFDLILSSLPNLVDRFRKLSIKSEVLRLGFEPSISARVVSCKRKIDASFVGTVAADHTDRKILLTELSALFELEIWGSDPQGLGVEAIRKYRGQAWGLDMFQVLKDSLVTINHHEHWSSPEHANNMRMYEATGMGSLVITDYKTDLHRYFEPGEEVLVYRTPQECAELVRFALTDRSARDRIAAAGQRRTLREHTYLDRMKELVDILGDYVK